MCLGPVPQRSLTLLLVHFAKALSKSNQKPTALDVWEWSYETYYADNAKQPTNHAAATRPKWNQAVFTSTCVMSAIV